MKRRFAILSFSAVLAACGGTQGGDPTPPTPTPTEPPPSGPPNIVMILADDMGYGDVSSFGGKVATPRLDQLAAEGARLTNFYVTSSVCAPSRASLLTGRWAARTGIPWNPPDRLNPDEITVAQVLQGAGYATGAVGKWHLGWVRDEMPIHHGFDSYYGMFAEDQDGFIRGDQPTTDRVGIDLVATKYTDEALDFLEAHKDERFFLYLAHRSPHLPNRPSPDFNGKSGQGAYVDVVQELDFLIGRLMDGLRDKGLEKNTLVFFTSDNGPPPHRGGSTGPFSGLKGTIGEGGVRVPTIARWPGHIPAGRVIDGPASTLDLFPTFVSLAGGTLPNRKLDGEDIQDLLTGQVDQISGPGIDGGREIVIWYSKHPGALRSGKWKYSRAGLWLPEPALYDLETDLGEGHNVYPDHKDIGQELELRLQQLVVGVQ